MKHIMNAIFYFILHLTYYLIEYIYYYFMLYIMYYIIYILYYVSIFYVPYSVVQLKNTFFLLLVV